MKAPSVNVPLRRALVALAAGHGELVAHSERSWASVTFTGARHTLRYRYSGEAAVAAAEVLIAELAEHEFTLPGVLVADALVTSVSNANVQRVMTVDMELLLLDDN